MRILTRARRKLAFRRIATRRSETVTHSGTATSRVGFVPHREDMLPLVAIGLLGGGAAYVCFGLLDSAANVESGYSISGAIVGLLLSWSALGSLYMNLRRDSREFGELVRDNRELSRKLLRSAPRRFELEVDDHQRVVLARPREWERGGGTIFDYQTGLEHMVEEDVFPARFSLVYEPVLDDVTPDQFYQRVRGSYDDYLTEMGASYSSETIQVGGTDGVRAIKFSAQAYARVALPREDRVGPMGEWRYVNRSEFRQQVGYFIDRAISRRTKHIPKDLEAMARLARLKEDLVPFVERALEKWEVDPTKGLAALVDELVGEHAPQLFAAAEEPEEAEEPAPGWPVGSAASSSAGQAVQELRPAPADDGAEPEEDGLAGLPDVITPVGRMIVVCYHPDLRKVYTFNFVDNQSDWRCRRAGQRRRSRSRSSPTIISRTSSAPPSPCRWTLRASRTRSSRERSWRATSRTTRSSPSLRRPSTAIARGSCASSGGIRRTAGLSSSCRPTSSRTGAATRTPRRCWRPRSSTKPPPSRY